MAEPARIAGLAVVVTVAVGLAGLWLAAPPMGTDLSAQVARADFFAGSGWAPVDFRWYGGVLPFGYSLLTPPVLAWFGPRPVGAAAAVVSTLALLALLRRTGARRPVLGAVLGAVCFTGNLVSGRVTFAVGIALALLATTVLIMEFPGAGRGGGWGVAGVAGRKVHDRPGGWGWWRGAGARAGRWAGVGVLAALAAAASPVAGLFVGLAGTAIVLDARLPRWPSYTERGQSAPPECPRSVKKGRGTAPGAAGGVALAAGAAVSIAVLAGLFGSGGWMNMSRSDLVHAAVTSLAVAALVPHRVVRIGALLSAAGVLAAYLVPTPVGLNATRLATLFALPVVAGYADLPGWLRRAGLWLRRAGLWLRRAGPARTGAAPLGGWVRRTGWLVPVLALLAWWQPPVIGDDLAGRGDPTADPGYFAPLRAELDRRPPGRVEVVPTEFYWESAHLGPVPLARGWLRQVDLGRNPLFFDGTLDAASYQRWLAGNGVSYVALANAEVSWIGRREAELIRPGLPYLTPVWRNQDWTLYEVDGPPAIVAAPGRLVEYRPDAVVVEAATAGDLLVRIRWSRWLAVTGPGAACLAPAGDWTEIRVTRPGEYRVTGSLTGAGPRC
jgi:hypothetical protein